MERFRFLFDWRSKKFIVGQMRDETQDELRKADHEPYRFQSRQSLQTIVLHTGRFAVSAEITKSMPKRSTPFTIDL
jgi:hypothetical protein